MNEMKLKTRDPGLAAAIEAAGGVTKLASLIGIRHVSVSKWRKVPAERVLEIERLLHGEVTRHAMRPDLYPVDTEAAD